MNPNKDCFFQLRTFVLTISILTMALYMIFIENYEEFKVEDFVDVKYIEQELDSANPVRHKDYVSPIDESLFVDWGNNDDDWYLNHRNCSDKKTHKYLHFKKVWHMANKMITDDSLHPRNKTFTDAILDALHTACIVKTDLLDIGKYESGTGEKWLVTLEGDQKAVVKIIWEDKGEMKKGGLCNTGFEMATSEIAAFHLHEILDFRNTPYVVGRQINLLEEIIPTATEDVARHIFKNQNNRPCLKGKCYRCETSAHICPEKNVLEASITLWINRPIKLHTFPPHFMPFSTPRKEKWSNKSLGDRSYCVELRETIEPYKDERLYLDLFDFAVLDTLMYHYDSKHYTIFEHTNRLTLRLDHGRAFCTYDREDDDVFLAPIKQCCTLRKKTYQNLVNLQGGRLAEELRLALESDALSPILKPGWYPVLDQRLKRILEMIEACFNKLKVKNVLVDDI